MERRLRTRIVLVVIAVLALLAALGSVAPARTQAAPAPMQAGQASMQIQDLTQTADSPSLPLLTIQGILDPSVPGVLCLAGATIVGSATPPAVATPCPGGELPIAVNAATIYVDKYGTGIPYSVLQIGDTLQVTATLSGAQLTGATVVDLSRPVFTPLPEPTYQATVRGVFASMPVANVLCLDNPSVAGAALQPQVTVANLCSIGELPLYLTAGTSVTDSTGAALALDAMRTGDVLAASGTLSGQLFSAVLLQDLSQPAATPPPPPPAYPLIIWGTLAPSPAGTLCLVNATVPTSGPVPALPTGGPCPSGQLSAALTNSTSYQDRNGNPATWTELQAGDMLHIAGNVTGNLFTATLVQDLSEPAGGSLTIVPESYQATLQGVLATTPGPIDPPLVLCLQSVRVTAGPQHLALAATGACVADQTPVQVGGATRIERPAGSRGGLDELRAGDKLRITGTVSHGRLTAETIVDLTIPASASVLVGTVVSVKSAAHPAAFTMRVQQGSARWVATIDVQPGTQIIVKGVAGQIAALHAGQVVTVLGAYDARTHRCATTFRIRVH